MSTTRDIWQEDKRSRWTEFQDKVTNLEKEVALIKSTIDGNGHKGLKTLVQEDLDETSAVKAQVAIIDQKISNILGIDQGKLVANQGTKNTISMMVSVVSLLTLLVFNIIYAFLG